MKLYQFIYSGYCAKVRKCLELKGLAFEQVEVPFLDRRELIALTGGSIVVPVLADGDKVICDSPRITAYLDERYAPSLRPPAIFGTASVFESWSDGVIEDVAFRLASPALERRVAAHNGGRDDARAMFRFTKERKFGAGCIEAWERSAPELRARMQALLSPLKPQPFLLGSQASLADAAVYGNLAMIEWAMPGWVQEWLPALSAWYARVDGARSI
jgi:glutathione S-transferase